MIQPNANELSTFIITISFFDEDNLPVEPETMAWTLRDASGAIVNNREDVVITPPIANIISIVLEGDDLALSGYYSNQRVITLTGTYNSVFMPNAPLVAANTFLIDPIIKTEKTGDSLSAMIQRLSVYYNDPDLKIITAQMRVRLLNEAMKKIVPQIARHRLHVLDIVYPDIELGANGSFNLESLVIPTYHGNINIDGIFIQSESYPAAPKGKFARLISFNERRTHDNKQIAGNADDPVWWMVGTNIFVDPAEAGNKINLHYMKKPALMYLDTEAEGHDVDCEFGEELQDIIIEYAAYWGLKYVIKDDARAQEALDLAMADIAMLNSGEAPTDSIRNQTDFLDRDSFNDSDFPIFVQPINEP